MDLRHWLEGMIKLSLTSAEIPRVLEYLANQHVSIYDTVFVDPFCIHFFVRQKDLKKVLSILEKRGEKTQILQRWGLKFTIANMKNRPALLGAFVALFLLTCWLPSRVLFVRVEGNQKVPTRQILEQAEQCGVAFLASRREVRSEKMKNALLECNPQLQWAGINTYGCTAVITVRERNDIHFEPQEGGISSIIASRDGVIRDITVQQGNAQCRVGQAVRKGQVLVSGYTDCGLYIKGTQAKADVFGETLRVFSAIHPTQYTIRGAQSSNKKKYSLIIGKKRINFFKGSGISGGTCAKIYEEKYLTLPGGFILPVGIALEEYHEFEYELEKKECSNSFLTQFADSYLSGQMQAGMVNRSDQTHSCEEAYCRMDGLFYCYELIGISRIEGSVTEHE